MGNTSDMSFNDNQKSALLRLYPEIDSSDLDGSQADVVKAVVRKTGMPEDEVKKAVASVGKESDAHASAGDVDEDEVSERNKAQSEAARAEIKYVEERAPVQPPSKEEQAAAKKAAK